MQTILIFRIGSIGDTVVALPCFHQVAGRYAGSRRILITNIPSTPKTASAEAVLTNSGLINDVIYFPSSRRVGDLLKLRSEIRMTKSNTLIYIADRDLGRALRDVCFFRACGIRHIFGVPWSRDLRLPRVDPANGLLEPEAQRLARCLAGIGPIDPDNRAHWDLRLQAEELRSGEAAVAAFSGAEYLAVNIGGKVESKDWGDDHWSCLLELMANDYAHIGLAFFGSSEERDRSGKIAARWPGRSLNLCGLLTPREAAAAMRRATAFLGHDSGPMHLAAAVGLTCVCMFGNFNRPKWWHPWGDQHRIIHDMRGVRAISPAEVYAALRSVESLSNRPLPLLACRC